MEEKRRTITIGTREEMDVFMNPRRQRLLRELDLAGRPMTAKQLSVALGVSASSATFHLRKLEELGLVELDHTELVRGITARYYRRSDALVELSSEEGEDLSDERLLLLEHGHSLMWEGFREYLRGQGGEPEDGVRGTAVEGFVHLSERDARELLRTVREFLDAHATPGGDTVPWELSLVAYPHREGRR